ncbi:MAG: hypothetical protein AAF993_10645 [Pseudomonadota bacterium]
MALVWIAVGLGCLWHGGLVIWVAPTPTQLRRNVTKPPRGTAQAFQIFWLDQYAWIGISLVVVGLLCVAVGVLS